MGIEDGAEMDTRRPTHLYSINSRTEQTQLKTGLLLDVLVTHSPQIRAVLVPYF